MREWVVHKSSVKGRLSIPPSKSHTLRAIVFALMANGTSSIQNYLPSPDTDAMLSAIEHLGAQIVYRDKTRLTILGVGRNLLPAEDVIDCGNSGQVLRFIGAIAALHPTYTILTGDHSIRHNRPIQPMLDALKHLGAFAESSRQDGFSPIVIKGPIQPGTACLDGADSQPVSALLIACSFLKGQSEIYVENPGEKPWIQLTLSWMDRLNLKYKHEHFQKYTIEGNGSYEGFDLEIPSDFSSASFAIVAALVTGSEIELENIDMTDVQGDKKLIYLLIEMGANIDVDEISKKLRIKKGSSLCGRRIDMNECIDALPILAVAACFATGPTEIYNAAIARKKESDRIHCMAVELSKMGARIEEKPDGLVITPAPLYGTNLFSHKDHRVAMALAVAGFAAKGKTTIKDVECAKKTYPGFANDFRLCGFSIEEI